MLRDDTPPHPTALNWSTVEPTGRLRWRLGRLQQEWGQDWSNEAGRCTALEWREVPISDGAYTEGASTMVTAPLEPNREMINAAAEYYNRIGGCVLALPGGFRWSEAIKVALLSCTKENSNVR